MKSRRFGILTTVTSCPVPDETTPKPKKIFLFQMSTEFSKDIFNGPQNWNELIQELPFASNGSLQPSTEADAISQARTKGLFNSHPTNLQEKLLR